MSEPQYRVIADRDKGDDPTWNDVHGGDRVTMTAGDISTFRSDQIVRIERPVPTTNLQESAGLEDRRSQFAASVGGELVRDLDAWPTEDAALRSLLDRAVDHIESIETDAHYLPPLPTREQIAALNRHVREARQWNEVARGNGVGGVGNLDSVLDDMDAVLALLQKGADR
jgi:hypothetical protein